MSSKKFFISWIVSSIVMLLLSYVWHGLILNDLRLLKFSLGLFFVFAGIAYLLVGAALAKLYSYSSIKRNETHPVLKGLMLGSILGIVFYICTVVLGVSFSRNLTTTDLIIDITWAAIEQGIGGVCVGLVHMLVWDDSMIRSEDMD